MLATVDFIGGEYVARIGDPIAALQLLPDIVAVMEGSLVIQTDDNGTAETAIDGLRYLLALEFARRLRA